MERRHQEEVHVKRYSTRLAASAAIMSLALGAGGAPCFAADRPVRTERPPLTRLSPATQRLLVNRAVSQPRLEQQPPTGDSSGSFLHSRRGAIALTLMAAGAGFAIWSANHDRQPVKSPIR
jgi:hypothetical protein